MNLFELDRLNVVSIDECIGYYDDLKDTSKNTFGKKKMFRKYKLTLHVLPTEVDYIKCNSTNYDIFSLYDMCKKKDSRTCWDIKPKIENGELVYYIRDKTPMKITNVFVELDDYYSYYEALKIIKKSLSNDSDKHITLGVEYREPMFSELRSYLGRKFDDHIIWK